jgi:spore coat polysaccharide biosynthesis predicted glycosyltransferase SpsG
MGAADINNISEKITNALLKVEGVDEIHLMLGVVNPHLSRLNKLKETYSEKVFMHFNLTAKQLIDLLQMCDGCICPASSISLEASAVGIGMISGYTAENQKGILRGLNKHKMAVDFGDFNLITESELIDKFTFLSKNIDLLQDCRVNQSTAIDRKSAIRIVQIFKNI